MVGVSKPIRIGDACLGVEGDVVDHVATERGEFDPVDGLGVRRARLGELAGDPADLHHRHSCGVLEHHRHLEDDLQLVAHLIGGEVSERLRTVARLQQERTSRCDLGEVGLKGARFACEHKWRKGRDVLEDSVKTPSVRPKRLLGSSACLPRIGGPRRTHPLTLTRSPSSCKADRCRGRVSRGQAAVTREAAASRTVFTARFTKRRAASAVTPRSSPTSR